VLPTALERSTPKDVLPWSRRRFIRPSTRMAFDQPLEFGGNNYDATAGTVPPRAVIGPPQQRG
jgi:hypothetical protein